MYFDFPLICFYRRFENIRINIRDSFPLLIDYASYSYRYGRDSIIARTRPTSMFRWILDGSQNGGGQRKYTFIRDR